MRPQKNNCAPLVTPSEPKLTCCDPLDASIMYSLIGWNLGFGCKTALEEQLKVGRMLVVGWDGAEPSIIERMLSKNLLPNLAHIISRGSYGRIESTTPDTSLSAWTSALTGMNPGRHGMVNFVRRPPGKYRLNLVAASDRLVPTILAMAHEEGRSVASFGVPGTWPMEPDLDFCIAGFDSPLATKAPRRAFHPESIYDELQKKGLSWPYGGMDELRMDSSWHMKAKNLLKKNIVRKRMLLEELAPHRTIDLLWVVFSESDTAGHHFWAFSDPDSPRYSKRDELADSIQDIYMQLDRALGRLMELMEPNASVLVLSDHGFMGAADHVVYVNRWLASKGFLKFRQADLLQRLAPAIQQVAGRLVPSAIKELILRTPLASLALGVDAKARFGPIDLKRTKAFCDELPQNPGIWLNVKHREPFGCIEAGDDFERTLDLVAEKLLAWRYPQSGKLVVSRVLRRQDAMHGPAARLCPDLLVELAHWDNYRLVAGRSGYSTWPLVRKLDKSEAIGPKGLGTSGAHAPMGICAAMGPSAETGARIENARLYDIAPSVLRILGIEPPGDMDGKPLQEIAPRPARPTHFKASGRTQGDLTPAEQEAINRKLEGLGYM